MKIDRVLAGMDIGTTSIKLSLYSLQGETLFDECEEYPTYYRQPRWAEQSPQDWKRVILSLLRKLSTRVKRMHYEVAGMGLSVHAPSLVFLDENGESLQDFVPIWCDERSADKVEKLIERVGPDFVGLGLPLASFPAKLLWYAEAQPETVRKAFWATGVKGYLLKWLTGELATDPSSEPGRQAGWASVMTACGWAVERLAPLFEAEDVVGRLRSEICDEVGLAQSFPVVTGLNDGGCSTLSSGAYRSGDACVELATNGVVYLVSDQPMAAETRLRHAFFCWNYVDGRWIIGGQTKCGASALKWANDLFGEKAAYITIDDYINIARKGPIGSDDVMFFPYLRGRGTPSDQPEVRAMFTGLLINTEKENLYRSVIEGVIFSMREIVDYLQQAGFPVERALITGGGAKSEFIRQTTADVLGVPLCWGDNRATLGAALLASIGVGIYGSIAEALSQMVPAAIEVTPNPQAYEVYEEFIRRYIKVRDHLLAMYG
ncbi:MAG: hypothetical protein IT308_08405 [Anaerolineaceae bacterium]|nr:hypothetical protein [Anaerolineaceae bacterium]